MAWHERRLSHKSEAAETLSVTWPPLSSGRHNVWLIAALKTPYLELMKRTRHPQQHIFSQSKLYKGRKGEHRRWRVILMNIWQGFFFLLLYPPVDSLSDFYKNPSFTHVCLSFIELAGDIFSTHWPWERVFNSTQHNFQERSIQLQANLYDFLNMKEK